MASRSALSMPFIVLCSMEMPILVTSGSCSRLSFSFLEWGFTDPSSIQWNKLPVCDQDCRLSQHSIAAGKIVTRAIGNNEAMSAYFKKIKKAKKAMEPLTAKFGAAPAGKDNDAFMENVMSRSFFDDEGTYFDNALDEKTLLDEALRQR